MKKANKRAESIIMGKPNIRKLFEIAKSLAVTIEYLLETTGVKFQNNRFSPDVDINSQHKYIGAVMGASVLFPYVCELALTGLYLLDNPKVTNIPKTHSLLYYWENLNKDTKNRIEKRLKASKNKDEKIEDNPEKILKKNDKSHTEWRYWWRKGFATGGSSSISMQYLIKAMIEEAGYSYSQKQIDRVLNEKLDGFKNFDEYRKRKLN